MHLVVAGSIPASVGLLGNLLVRRAGEEDYEALLVERITLIRRLPLTPVSVDPQVLAAYAGRYPLPDGSIVTIRVDGTRIFIQLPAEPEYELYASSENHFYLPVDDLEITFYRNNHGEVEQAVGVVNGVTYEANKVP